MTARFVLDESSWTEASGTDRDALSNAIHQLLERLDVARERNEGVVKHKDYYETGLGGGVHLYSALFERDSPLQFDHDLTERLYLALDRVNDYDDTGLVEYDAEYGGSVRFAPSVVWAHACCSEGRHVAVLPLPLAGVPSGRVPVAVGGVTNEIVFVTEEIFNIKAFFGLLSSWKMRTRPCLNVLQPLPFRRWSGLIMCGEVWETSAVRTSMFGVNSFAIWADLTIMVQRAFTSIARATLDTCRRTCRRESVRRLRMRMDIPRGIDRPSETARGDIAEPTRYSGGTSSCNRMWIGSTFCMTLRCRASRKMNTAASSWAHSRTTASCHNEGIQAPS